MRQRSEVDQCQGVVEFKATRIKMRCEKRGHHYLMTGSFGRSDKVFCEGCAKRYESMGWKIALVIKGDKPT